MAPVKERKVPYILNGTIFRIKERQGDKVYVQCVCCRKMYVCKNLRNGTGNWHKHIKRSHPHLVDRAKVLKKEEVLATDERRRRRQRLLRNNGVDEAAEQEQQQPIKNEEDNSELSEEEDPSERPFMIQAC